MLHAERWGTLRERYEPARPRRLLSLEGGGILKHLATFADGTRNVA